MEIPRTKHSVCGMCAARCPVEVEFQEGCPRWIRGHAHILGGALCPRGAAGLALLHDDARLRQPLLRAGERGEGRWREAGWEEALNHVADRLRNVLMGYGGKSLLWSEPSGPCSDLNKAFVRGLHSPNYCTHEAIYNHNADQALWFLANENPRRFLPDYRHCRHLVLQNRNLFESLDVREVNDVLDALDAGCRLTVVDVRASVTACKADTFLRLRPGTDYALNLAVIHILLHENLYDTAHAKNRTDGLEALAQFVEPYTPQWAARECGIPASSIIALARALHDAAPAVIWHPGRMTSRYAQSFMVCRTACIINTLLGSLDRTGGLLRLAAPSPLVPLEASYPAPEEQRADGVGGQFLHFAPGSSLLRHALAAVNSGIPYPVKAYVAFNHDPLAALPDPKTLRTWMEKLDLLVSVTVSWSCTAWYADVVLPLSTYLERDSPVIYQPGLPPRLLMRRRVVPPLHDTRADWEITVGLAQRLGLDKLAFTRIEDIWQRQLHGTGLTEKDFIATGFVTLPDSVLTEADSYPTPSGKLEIAPGNRQEPEVETLRPYVPPAMPPAGHFRLILGHTAQQMEEIPRSFFGPHMLMPENAAWVHPERAAALDLRQGELAVLRAGDGTRALVRVYTAENMHPEGVFLVYGFGRKLPMEIRNDGHKAADQEFRPGGLERLDAVGGGLAFQEHFVSLEKIRRNTAEDILL